MIIRRRNPSIIRASIILMVLSAMNTLLEIPGFNNQDYRLIFILGVFLVVFIFSKRTMAGMMRLTSKQFRRYPIWCTISLSLLALYTMKAYPAQSPLLTIRVVSQYMMVIWAIPIYILISRDHSEKYVLELINFISVVWCLLILLQSIVYTINGSMLFSFLDNSLFGYREERLRYSVGPFANFSLIYCFWYIYFTKIKKKLYHTISFAILLLTNIFVQQSRMAIIAIIVTMIVMILMEKRSGYRIFRKLSIIFALICFLILTDYVESYFESIFTKYDVSISSRIYSYSYYWGVFKSNPLFGFGLLKTDLAYQSILYGPLGMASMDDVGFVGQMAALGIFSIVIIAGIYVYMMRVIILIKRNTKEIHSLLLGAFVYLLCTTPTLIVFDQQRICLVPLLIALFEYQLVQSKNIKLST